MADSPIDTTAPPEPPSPWDIHATALVEALEGMLGIRLSDEGAMPLAMDYLTKRAAARDPLLVPGIDKVLDALEGMAELLRDRPEVQAVLARLTELQAVMKGAGPMSPDTRAWIDQLVVSLFLILSQPEEAATPPAPEPVPERVYRVEDFLPPGLMEDLVIEPLEPLEPDAPLVDPTIATRTIEDVRRALGLDPSTGEPLPAPPDEAPHLTLELADDDEPIEPDADA